MATVTPSSISNISLTPRISSITEKNNLLTRCTFSRKNNKRALPAQKYIIPPLSTSLRLFPQFRFGCNVQPKQRYNRVSATGTDVAVEETDLPAPSNEATDTTSEATTESSSSKPETNPTQVKRSRPSRKSEMPPVKNEELVPGATFTGKVRSVQPFGAFVDFGAFTDGLVHVSQLSDSFVKDVASFVTVGQEVKVRLVEANMETGRISLTMRKSDDASSGDKNNKSRPPRKSGQQKFNQKNDMNKKSTNLVRGQELEGTVKNITRSGAFISLPEGEEGFLPQSEEADEGFVSMMGGSSLEIGQEVSVKVLRINRGQATLTMKKDEDVGDLESKLNQGVVHTATNPFVLAFRSNKEISAFLDERKNEEELSPVSSQIADVKASSAVVTGNVSLSTKEQVTEEVPASTQVEAEENKDVADAISKDEEQSQEPSSVENKDLSELSIEDMEEQVTEEVPASTQAEAVAEAEENKDVADAILKDEEQSQEPSSVENKGLSELATEEVPAPSEVGAVAEEGKVSEEPSSVENKDLSELSTEEVPAPSEVGAVAVAEEGKVSEEPSSVESKDLSELSGEITEETTDVVNEPIEKSDETIDTTSQGEEEIAAQNLEENGGIESSTLKADSPENEVAGETSVSEVLAQASSDEGVNTNGSSDSLEKENTAKAAISPSLVKQLRDETGAGMMDCKKALSETGGDLEKAQEYLRKKGLASADKKSSRVTAEGRIGSYIHDSRIGILIEVNCETDFVARGDIFKELVEDLAMQAAACPQVQYLNTEDVPKEIVEKEREIEMQKEDLLSKPEQIRSKIVDGRIRKRLEELALLEQPFIKDDKVLVKDWVKQTISTVGENIKVKRFERYNLGEGLEKKSQDFAAEVAAQTAAKAGPTPVKQETEAASETTEITEKPQTVAVSAALVKQLREETGAGMMDCKKALSETGGDIEKAQEYLRKKGLSTADKKSSRLAAEGRIGSYIHDSRIGVLIEVNSETDFVARGQNFKELVDDLAMQVVACPQVQYVSIEDIPESIVSKEKQLEMQREDLQSKPENIREKIVEGRITKRLGELALLEQPFIKDDSMLVKDLVKQTVAALGENIKVRRFVRYTLGETSEAQVEDSAAWG